MIQSLFSLRSLLSLLVLNSLVLSANAETRSKAVYRESVTVAAPMGLGNEMDSESLNSFDTAENIVTIDQDQTGKIQVEVEAVNPIGRVCSFKSTSVNSVSTVYSAVQEISVTGQRNAGQKTICELQIEFGPSQKEILEITPSPSCDLLCGNGAVFIMKNLKRD